MKNAFRSSFVLQPSCLAQAVSGQFQEHVLEVGRADGDFADGAVVLGGQGVQGGQGGLLSLIHI